MATRLLEIVLPKGADDNLEELLGETKPLGVFRRREAGEPTVLHLLVRAEQAEGVMDRFEQAGSGVDGFALVLLPTEATLPRLEPLEEEISGEQDVDSEDEAEETPHLRISREELYHQASESVALNRAFLALTSLSSIVAAIGLMRDDLAVVIGAMVIAPLLGPNSAMSLAATLGDFDLLKRALRALAVGALVAFALAAGIGSVFEFDADSPAIVARSRVGFGDLALALAAGAAGTLAQTRGLAASLIGVMVAVALLPPTIAGGLLLGAGQAAAGSNALLLALANVISINVAGIATYLLQGVRPRTWWEAERARLATLRAIGIWGVLLAALAAAIAARALLAS